MKEFVLDCSATLPWVFGSEATKATDALLSALGEGTKAWVPALWHLEVANALLGAQRRGRIDAAGIKSFLAALARLDIKVDAETMTVAWSRSLALAERHGLTAYGAAYLELSLRLGLPLASLDADLRRTVKRVGGGLAL